MTGFGTSLDEVKGALICGRSPHDKRALRGALWRFAYSGFASAKLLRGRRQVSLAWSPKRTARHGAIICWGKVVSAHGDLSLLH